jgi:hypothetical protein
LPWHSWVFLVEVGYSLWRVDFRCIFPAVMFRPISFPLDFELESAAEHLAVQDFGYQIFFFPFYDFRWWRQRPAIGSVGAEVSLTTLKTGCNRLIKNGRRNR